MTDCMANLWQTCKSWFFFSLMGFVREVFSIIRVQGGSRCVYLDPYAVYSSQYDTTSADQCLYPSPWSIPESDIYRYLNDNNDDTSTCSSRPEPIIKVTYANGDVDSSTRVTLQMRIMEARHVSFSIRAALTCTSRMPQVQQWKMCRAT